jgi:DNA-binding NarL/FixJ family response regulator
MNTNDAEILIIDDDISFAKTISDIIEARCTFKTAVAETPNKALTLFNENPIKIVIFDQVMPVVTGIELYKKLKQYDSQFKAILLTGEASPKEITEATHIGFDKILMKANANEYLCPAIFKIYLEYENENCENINDSIQPVFTERVHNSIFSSIKKNYYLVDYQIMNQEYIKDTEWIVYRRIDAGEEKEVEIYHERELMSKISASNKLFLEDSSSLNIDGGFLMEFKNDLQLKLQNTFNDEKTDSIKMSIKEILKTRMPDSGYLESKQLAAITYECDPVYYHLKVFLVRICSCCKSKEVIPLIVDFPLSKIAHRRQEYYSDGIVKTINTGFDN